MENETKIIEATDIFTVRELRLIRDCLRYDSGDAAGLPGHNLMVIISKMARVLGWDRDSLLKAIEGQADAPTQS